MKYAEKFSVLMFMDPLVCVRAVYKSCFPDIYMTLNV